MKWFDRLLLQWSRRHTRAAIVLALIIGTAAGIVIHAIADIIVVVPDIVRVDLDDIAGIDLLGIAALITAVGSWKRTQKNGYVEKQDHEYALGRIHELEKEATVRLTELQHQLEPIFDELHPEDPDVGGTPI